MSSAGQQAVTPLSTDELEKVIDPDMPGVSGEFTFGQNKDGTPRHWPMKPLLFRFEKLFRKTAMPLLASQFKPFETLIGAMSQPLYNDTTPSVLNSLVNAELEVDDRLVDAVHAILLAYDKTITRDWVEANAESRDQLLDIVTREAELHRLMDRLGESLVERLSKLASVMGLQIDLHTMRQLWKQVSANFSAKITQFVSTGANVFGQFTESSSATLTRKSSSSYERTPRPSPLQSVVSDLDKTSNNPLDHADDQ